MNFSFAIQMVLKLFHFQTNDHGLNVAAQMQS